MTKWDIFMLCTQTMTIATTAVNFWCFYKVPIIKRALKVQGQAFDVLLGRYDGLVKEHRQAIEDAAKLEYLLNGRR